MKIMFPIAALAALSLAACSEGQDAASEPMPDTALPPVATPTAGNFDAWAGRWIGVEGMFAEVTPKGDGLYDLELQSDLDTHGTYTGTATAGGIAFERDGEQLMLYRNTGSATGLKYLEGKSNCLMVKPGEGYCRD